MKSEETKVCCICKQQFTGYGNNALPVREGQCCDKCNITIVIPTRIKLVEKKQE